MNCNKELKKFKLCKQFTIPIERLIEEGIVETIEEETVVMSLEKLFPIY